MKEKYLGIFKNISSWMTMFLRLKNSPRPSRINEEVDTNWKFLVNVYWKETHEQRSGVCTRSEQKENCSKHFPPSTENESLEKERSYKHKP